MVGRVSMSLGFYSLRATSCARRRAPRVKASGIQKGRQIIADVATANKTSRSSDPRVERSRD